MQETLQQNEVYEIAKKIAATKDESQQNDMLEELSEVIAKHFEDNNSKPIEDAIRKALNEENLEASNIIMDEVYLEIESLYFEGDNDTEFDSTMQIIPCTITTDKDNVVVPSIDNFEEIIRKNLLDNQLIERPEQFKLGTLFLSEDDLTSFKFQDWWNIHRGIVEEDTSEKPNFLKSRDQKIQLIPDATVSLFCLVPIIVDQDGNLDLVDAIYNSYVDVDAWGKIGAELSTEDFKISVFPPMGIAETIQQSTYIIQDVEFDEFFDEYTQDETTEVGYIQIADDPDEYIVLFFDGEDHTLSQFYHYGTQGDAVSFVTMLVEKCIKNNYQTLFSFEEKIDMETIETWRNTEGPILITKLLKQSNPIDLDESYRMSMINNLISDSEMDSYKTKRTIH
jgi:hypothetical protein